MHDTFISPTQGKLKIDDVVREIIASIENEPQESYELVIGTDSQGRGTVDFVTAIVIYKKGKGGRYFWNKFRKENINSLRHKIYEEVNTSLIVSQRILGRMEENWKKIILSNFEIHIDIGQNGPTKDLIKELTGFVLGNGFKAKIKPESYGASIVADKYL